MPIVYICFIVSVILYIFARIKGSSENIKRSAIKLNILHNLILEHKFLTVCVTRGNFFYYEDRADYKIIIVS